MTHIIWVNSKWAIYAVDLNLYLKVSIRILKDGWSANSRMILINWQSQSWPINRKGPVYRMVRYSHSKKHHQLVHKEKEPMLGTVLRQKNWWTWKMNQISADENRLQEIFQCHNRNSKRSFTVSFQSFLWAVYRPISPGSVVNLFVDFRMEKTKPGTWNWNSKISLPKRIK